MTGFMPAIDDESPELVPSGGNGGGQLVPTETRIGDVVSMRRAAMLMPRQPREVRRLIAEAAEMFGDSWDYRFPVKNTRTGETDWIEGPTIGCTMAVARAYGNNDVAHTRTEDDPKGNAWILYSTFVDLQSGFSLTRGFRQRKGQSRMGRDRERGEDIDFQIGVSKSTRNVVARALDDYVQYARQCARARLAGAISQRANEYRERIQAYLEEIGYPLTAIEGALGATMPKWSNEQIAAIVRTLTAHKDGILRDLDDVYRPKAVGAEDAMPQEAPVEAQPQERRQQAEPARQAPAAQRQPEAVQQAPEADRHRPPRASRRVDNPVMIMGTAYRNLSPALERLEDAVKNASIEDLIAHKENHDAALNVIEDTGLFAVTELRQRLQMRLAQKESIVVLGKIHDSWDAAVDWVSAQLAEHEKEGTGIDAMEPDRFNEIRDAIDTIRPHRPNAAADLDARLDAYDEPPPPAQEDQEQELQDDEDQESVYPLLDANRKAVADSPFVAHEWLNKLQAMIADLDLHQPTKAGKIGALKNNNYEVLDALARDHADDPMLVQVRELARILNYQLG